MNHRQRFNNTMHYQPVDRPPLCDYGYWDETLPVWKEQGLPGQVDKKNIYAYLGLDYNLDDLYDTAMVEVRWFPRFEEKVIEDRGDHELFQQLDGVRVLRRKFMSSIPTPVQHLLTDRESWNKYYKPLLDPNTPGRFPPDLAARVENWRDPDRENLVVVRGGGLYGYLRNWMGLEKLSMVIYDDPAFFEEMVFTLADCVVGTLEKVLATGGIFDACAMWEDMCYSSGPLISPRHFKKYIVPQYRRITDLLHKHGVDIIFLDSDGNVDRLVPLWLEAGINCLFPMEVGSWGADPLDYRKRYGKDLRMMGGFDKRILAGSKDSISGEVVRLAPLVEEGGYIPCCDHLVPPFVPLENYCRYAQAAREIWGHDIDLRPIQDFS
jgi:uroporphyrinogen decarboxylase